MVKVGLQLDESFFFFFPAILYLHINEIPYIYILQISLALAILNSSEIFQCA